MSKTTKYRFKASWGDRNVGDPADPQSSTFEFLKANGIVEEIPGEKVKDEPVAEVVAEAKEASEATEQPAETAPSVTADADTKPKTSRKAK